MDTKGFDKRAERALDDMEQDVRKKATGPFSVEYSESGPSGYRRQARHFSGLEKPCCSVPDWQADDGPFNRMEPFNREVYQAEVMRLHGEIVRLNTRYRGLSEVRNEALRENKKLREDLAGYVEDIDQLRANIAAAKKMITCVDTCSGTSDARLATSCPWWTFLGCEFLLRLGGKETSE